MYEFKGKKYSSYGILTKLNANGKEIISVQSYSNVSPNELLAQLEEQRTPDTIFIGVNDNAMTKKWELQYNEFSDDDKWIIETAYNSSVTNETKLNNNPKKVLTLAKNNIMDAGFANKCTRCNGTGKYSFNEVWKDVCMKCEGQKRNLPKLSERTKKKIADHFNKQTCY